MRGMAIWTVVLQVVDWLLDRFFVGCDVDVEVDWVVAEPRVVPVEPGVDITELDADGTESPTVELVADPGLPVAELPTRY